jgi:hypothetical protein
MNCQNHVAATPLPQPALPRHCQRENTQIIRDITGNCHSATALPLLTAKWALFRESLVAVITFGSTSERASALSASVAQCPQLGSRLQRLSAPRRMVYAGNIQQSATERAAEAGLQPAMQRPVVGDAFGLYGCGSHGGGASCSRRTSCPYACARASGESQ